MSVRISAEQKQMLAAQLAERLQRYWRGTLYAAAPRTKLSAHHIIAVESGCILIAMIECGFDREQARVDLQGIIFDALAILVPDTAGMPRTSRDLELQDEVLLAWETPGKHGPLVRLSMGVAWILLYDPSGDEPDDDDPVYKELFRESLKESWTAIAVAKHKLGAPYEEHPPVGHLR